jgi:hypothetical protein
MFKGIFEMALAKKIAEKYIISTLYFYIIFNSFGGADIRLFYL